MPTKSFQQSARPTLRLICLGSAYVVRYDALIRTKSPTNCDAHYAESLFQTRSSRLLFCQKDNVVCQEKEGAMTVTMIRIMFALGIAGHALNMYCDRILSIFRMELSNLIT